MKHSPISFKCQALYNYISTNKAEVRQEGTLSHRLWAPVSWLLLLITATGLREVSRRKSPVMINYESWLWVPVVISVAEMLYFATGATMAIRALCLFLATPGVWCWGYGWELCSSQEWSFDQVLLLSARAGMPQEEAAVPGYVCNSLPLIVTGAACFQNHLCVCFLYYF